ncbi:FAD-linked oxidoreductase azaL [Gracilariopsis chorda]|uniref:FAD-linked oxidoreductase azaL n=1 Tax=Gracilariopsis chorda TaxID=448386 RepID=A0A2V3IUU4_9FLOR|nr:FAD-linked oxidoreductase azaL [Gracilariopsis chorda]|eukprot:PXF45906.1 FAD-linked oxidoreductase azaL [Gracilariopsis chorda]
MAQSNLAGSLKIDPRLNQNEPTFFPSSEQELSKLLLAISGGGYTVQMVYSGTQLPGSVSAAADVIVNVSNLKQINVSGDKVQVGISASIGSLVETLGSYDLFLPLSDVSSNSILESLTGNSPGYFDLSVGRLRSFLLEVSVVSFKGQPETLRIGSDESKIEALLSGTDTSLIVTSVVFKALPGTQLSDLWLGRLVFPYSKSGWDTLNELVFGPDMPNNVDVTVQTAKIFGGLPIIVLTVVSIKVQDSSDVFAKLTSMPSEALKVIKESVVHGASVMRKAQFSQGIGRRTWNKDVSFKNMVITAEDRTQVLAKISELLNQAIGVTGSRVRLLPRLNLSLRVSKGTNGELNVHAELYMPKTTIQQAESEYHTKFNSFFPASSVPNSVPTVLTSSGISSAAGKPDLKVLASLFPLKEAHIPGFSGPTFMQGDEDYTEAATQYATSSYPPERSNPFIVGYPQTAADIKTAVAFAKTNKKSIVARSGGHQYSCLSGGDQSVIVLSMERFSYASTVSGDVPNLVVVGSGTPLTHASTFMTDNKLTVPHGECPLVCVGGHTQSGGYGHTIRSQGLLVDYVRSFRIVLADSSYIQVYRPNVDATDKHEHNDDIYYGVLGGGPGSFGVVTEYTYETVHDDDHPYSTGLSCAYMYSKKRFRNIMKIVQEWTQGIKEGTLQGDMDLMATAISIDLESLFPEDMHDQGSVPGAPPPDAQPSAQYSASVQAPSGVLGSPGRDSAFEAGALQLELLYGNESGQPDTTSPPTKDRFRQMHKRVISDDWILPLPYMLDFDSDEHHSLSFMCDSWVRRFGTTLDGREFVYPYHKRLNGTFEPLSDDFINGFVDLVHEVICDRRVRMVFQMGLGVACITIT